MNPTIPIQDLSTEVLKNTVVDGLESYVSGTEPLTDPLDNRTQTQFILTSWPDSGLELPHIIVSEFSDDATPLDLKQDVDQHDYQVSVRVLGRNNHERAKLKDQTRQFLQKERIRSFRDAGFANISISTNESQWDETGDYEEIQHVVTGLVHTRV